jgi:hypothetical protein
MTSLGGPETSRWIRRNEELQWFRGTGAATRDVGLEVQKHVNLWKVPSSFSEINIVTAARVDMPTQQ